MNSNLSFYGSNLSADEIAALDEIADLIAAQRDADIEADREVEALGE
jgi:hypothetical protein